MRLDLGFSYRQNAPVLNVIMQQLPATLILMLAATAIALVVGVTAGVLASIRVNTVWDSLISLGAVFFFAAPSFWLGIMMAGLFAVKLGWCPVGGMRTIGSDHGPLADALDVMDHLVLPATALGLFYAATYARVMRASMLEVFRLDFVRTARAKGLSPTRVLLAHVMRNALLPIITLLGLQLGTDSPGRDIAAMIAHGARTTLLIGLCASLTATIIGISVGAIAAYFGGWVDELLMRLTELFQTIPNLIFVLTIVAILGQKIQYVTIAVGIVTWTPIARLTRAEFMSLRDREFVQACRSMGMGNLRIMFGEILPNALPPVIVLSSLVIAGAVLFESAVSFLGLGDPNVSSWGRLIGHGRTLIRRSLYICAVPGAAIMLTVLALNLVGDGLNDALNPKLRDR